MLWLQVSNYNSVNNLDNVRSEASGHFRNKELKLMNLKLTLT